ncbi:MAG: endonuclease III [Clostridiales Family XIII bacterium]|jgi:endonuclease-3|nr:endonuclease III [Clostridiales Family XIII bacterium]
MKIVLQKKSILEVLNRLRKTYGDAECALNHKNVWELLVAVSLSAQTTDVSVNKVTPRLFSKWPDPESLSHASLDDVRNTIRTIGMYNQKSANVIEMAGQVCTQFGGEVPHDFDSLVTLKGVGRKTANVVLSVGFGEQRIAVDTHVFRVSNRIGLCHEKDVLKTEEALMNVVPNDRWSDTHHELIWHGRQICHARKPECDACVLVDLCLYVK